MLLDSSPEVDCVAGDMIQIIKADDGDQDEDAWLNNSDDETDDRPGRIEAGSGFGGTRLGGGGGGSSRAAPPSSSVEPSDRALPNGDANGSVVAKPAEEEWEVLPVDADVRMADPAEPKTKSCPGCSEYSRPLP